MRIIPKITDISLLCLFSSLAAFGHEAESPLPF